MLSVMINIETQKKNNRKVKKFVAHSLPLLFTYNTKKLNKSQVTICCSRNSERECAVYIIGNTVVVRWFRSFSDGKHTVSLYRKNIRPFEAGELFGKIGLLRQGVNYFYSSFVSIYSLSVKYVAVWEIEFSYQFGYFGIWSRGSYHPTSILSTTAHS